MTTPMIYFVGWALYDLNSMFQMCGVDERNFQSALRRVFLWEPKARFIDAEVIKGVPGCHLDGHFAKDEELKIFFRAGPSAAAALRLLNAFEVSHSAQECRQMIEPYAAKPLAEDRVREACSNDAARTSQALCRQSPLKLVAKSKGTWFESWRRRRR